MPIQKNDIIHNFRRQHFYGDLNSDGKIDTRDYVLLQRYASSSLRISIKYQAADLNGDEKINSLDATLVGRYILGIIDQFPVSTNAIYASIDTSIKHQTMEGFGASIAYYQNWLIDHLIKQKYTMLYLMNLTKHTTPE